MSHRTRRDESKMNKHIDSAIDPDAQQMIHFWENVIVEGIEEALFTVDREWRFTYVNHRARAIWGRTKEDLLGNVMWELFPTLIGGPFEPFYRQVMASGKSNHLEAFSRLTQAWYDVRVYPVPQGLIVYIQDITTRKHLEQALQASEMRLQALSDAALEGIVVHDTQVIIDANQAALHMCGYSSLNELIGLPLTHFVTPESWNKVQRYIAANSEEMYEFVLVHKDGSRFPVEGRAKWITYQGQMVRIGVFRDITLRKRAAAQFVQMQRLESVERFANGVAHDFNNLLNIILNSTELASLEVPLGNEAHALLHVTQEATRRGAGLIQQLLTFSRKQIPNLCVVNVNQVIHMLQPLLQRLLSDTTVLVVVPDPDLKRVRADVEHLEQILLNLAANARDAMPKGGTLTIQTGHTTFAQNDALRPADIPPGQYVRLSIQDTGIGMDEQTQCSVFEPFFTTKAPGKGTGLGLATVYGMVKEHGGSIECSSTVNHGTTFTIYLPQLEDTPVSLEPM